MLFNKYLGVHMNLDTVRCDGTTEPKRAEWNVIPADVYCTGYGTAMYIQTT